MATAREALRRLRADWTALETERRYAWGRTFGAWLGIALLATAASTRVGRAVEPRIEAWESEVLRSLDAQRLVSFNTGLWIEAFGNGFILWTLVLAATFLAAWHRLPLVAASLFLGFGSLYANIVAGWMLWPRERPTLIQGGAASPGALGSFPSGHVAQAVFVYGLLAYLWIRASPSPGERLAAGGAVILMVAAVALGRLRLGAHWPSDIAAGLVVGGVWLAGVAHALSRSTR
jgi:undecaprenyl-diphosphatase